MALVVAYGGSEGRRLHHEQMDELTAEHAIQVLIPPDASNGAISRPGWNGGRYAFMRRGLAASRSEWRLIAAMHNLTKLHRHHLAASAA